MRNHGILIMSLVAWTACSSRGGETRTNLSMPIHITPEVVVQGADGSIQRTLNPLGDEISNGDHIYANVTSQENVFIFLGFCDGSTFKLYPDSETGPLISAKPGQPTRIPEKGGLGINGNMEFEVIYVIASSSSHLTLASADLQVKLTKSRGTPDGDCSPPPRDRSGSQIPIDQPIDRGADGIKVERYQLKRRPTKPSE